MPVTFTPAILSDAEFQLHMRMKSARIHNALRQQISVSVADADDVRQEFLLAALRVLEKNKEYENLLHFVNEVALATSNYIKNRISEGALSPTGVHAVYLRTQGARDALHQDLANVAETSFLHPYRIGPVDEDDATPGMLPESLLGEAILDPAFPLPGVDFDAAARSQEYPGLYRVFSRERIPVQERSAILPQLAAEFCAYIRETGDIPLWEEELADEGEYGLRLEAESRYRALMEAYQQSGNGGRAEMLEHLMESRRRTAAETLGWIFFVCVTGRGERGPYKTKNTRLDTPGG